MECWGQLFWYFLYLHNAQISGLRKMCLGTAKKCINGILKCFWGTRVVIDTQMRCCSKIHVISSRSNLCWSVLIGWYLLHRKQMESCMHVIRNIKLGTPSVDTVILSIRNNCMICPYIRSLLCPICRNFLYLL